MQAPQCPEIERKTALLQSREDSPNIVLEWVRVNSGPTAPTKPLLEPYPLDARVRSGSKSADQGGGRECPVSPVISTDRRNTHLGERTWSDGHEESVLSCWI